MTGIRSSPAWQRALIESTTRDLVECWARLQRLLRSRSARDPSRRSDREPRGTPAAASDHFERVRLDDVTIANIIFESGDARGPTGRRLRVLRIASCEDRWVEDFHDNPEVESPCRFAVGQLVWRCRGRG